MQEEFALVLKLTFDTNTIYIVIYWAKIVFSICLQRDLLRFENATVRLLLLGKHLNLNMLTSVLNKKASVYGQGWVKLKGRFQGLFRFGFRCRVRNCSTHLSQQGRYGGF